MYRGHRVGVVVPAYNEEGFVGRVIDTVPAFVDRIYAIDDCSTDGTWGEIRRHARRANEPPAAVSLPDGGEGIVREERADGREWTAGEGDDGAAGNGDGGVGTEGRERAVGDGREHTVDGSRPDGSRSDGRVVPLQHTTNRGVGGAIKTGYRHAHEDGMDVIAVMNGDGQMDPDILDRFLDPIVANEADYVKGNRLSNPAHREEMSRWRFFGNSVLTLLTKVASGYWEIADPQNGYTAIDAGVLEAIDLDGLYDEYGFCNDLLVTLNVHGMTVADVPMRAVYGDETSTIRYRSFVPRLSWLLLDDFCWRLDRRYVHEEFHPLVFCYALGAGGWVAGVLAAVDALVRRRSVAGLVDSVSVLLLGSLLFVLGMILDKAENEHLQRRIDAARFVGDDEESHRRNGDERHRQAAAERPRRNDERRRGAADGRRRRREEEQ